MAHKLIAIASFSVALAAELLPPGMKVSAFEAAIIQAMPIKDVENFM